MVNNFKVIFKKIKSTFLYLGAKYFFKAYLKPLPALTLFNAPRQTWKHDNLVKPQMALAAYPLQNALKKHNYALIGAVINLTAS